jgi:predicted anti-sigma-YlaC factor YlaD
VGAMTLGSCDQARGQLALAAIGRLPENEKLALEAHLEGCPACRIEYSDLSGLEKALSAADPDRLDQIVAVPGTLRSAVLGTLDTEASRHRRAMRMRFATAAAVVLLALGAGVIAIVSSGQKQPPATHTIALSGPGGAHATVELTAESWGTAVDLRAYEASAHGFLTVSMRADNGRWWVAGTYQAVTGSPVDVKMSCAVPSNQIDAIEVTNEAGQRVLGSYDS